MNLFKYTRLAKGRVYLHVFHSREIPIYTSKWFVLAIRQVKLMWILFAMQSEYGESKYGVSMVLNKLYFPNKLLTLESKTLNQKSKLIWQEITFKTNMYECDVYSDTNINSEPIDIFIFKFILLKSQ